MNNAVHFSSATDMWETPMEIFNELDKEFDFQMDVCATHENWKVSKYFTKEDDGLKQNWDGYRCWMNPPYGREIGKWVEKAATGGGSSCCGLTSLAHRHTLVLGLYLSETECRNSFYQGKIKVRRAHQLSTISKHDRDIQAPH